MEKGSLLVGFGRDWSSGMSPGRVEAKHQVPRVQALGNFHHVVHEHSHDCSAAALGRLAVHAGPNRLQQPRLVRSSGFHGHPVESAMDLDNVAALTGPSRPRRCRSFVSTQPTSIRQAKGWKFICPIHNAPPFSRPRVPARPVQPLRRWGLRVGVGLMTTNRTPSCTPPVCINTDTSSGGLEHAGLRA